MDAARLEEKYNKELEEMTDHIQSGIKDGKFTMDQFQRALSEKTRQAAAATDGFVRDNPWAAFGIAAGVGCLLGALLSLSRR